MAGCNVMPILIPYTVSNGQTVKQGRKIRHSSADNGKSQ
ncbi:hypothetical protein CHCC20441_4281 [Bacillus licheniformis]|uniref:Uncharacterized protein n=1 Tax=Bacillus licheniformis TaxID=1402 RepID=A0A8B5YEY1_BACLI|nr:hypothetical protein B4092_0355 [Bacillus licheniformis]TWN08092.1 hypothetical protein CHCC14564_2604 [Bacillus licheniformis LMG 17339]KYC85873.1 hypothetical protein B4091_0355 [Bacillus licheniformis]KYD00757.1 hypothetical protein B4164_0245 [Bacillus licheniformis]OLF88625.1 hypothetical protein B4089_3384 [Bacillus licheniformis]